MGIGDQSPTFLDKLQLGFGRELLGVWHVLGLDLFPRVEKRVEIAVAKRGDIATTRCNPEHGYLHRLATSGVLMSTEELLDRRVGVEKLGTGKGADCDRLIETAYADKTRSA